jgi:hypothetical protein
MILIVVSILLALMSLAAIGSVALMQAEYQAARMRGDELILENAADSGVEWLAALARESRQNRVAAMPPGSADAAFRDRSLSAGNLGDDFARYALLLPYASTASTDELAFGFANESAKLNLRSLLEWDRRWPGSAERALMQLPGMTPGVADKILDWIDADSQPRPQGGERDRYAADRLPYGPPNAVPETLDELLLVPGVRRADLFGEVPDSGARRQESDGPFGASRAGRENRIPWARFLTVISAERNESFEGRPRVFLNSPDLADLHQQLSERLGVEWANFVIALRQFGISRSSRGMAATSLEPNFAIPPKYALASELDLVGTRVPIAKSGRTAVLLSSPLAANRAGWAGELGRVMDQVTLSDQPTLPGRINIDAAPREVLMAIPQMDLTTVDRILATRMLVPLGQSDHVHASWLLEQGIVDAKRLGDLLPYLSTGGDVFQADVVAYFTDRPQRVRQLVAVDGTNRRRSQLYCKDLRDRATELPPVVFRSRPAVD